MTMGVCFFFVLWRPIEREARRSFVSFFLFSFFDRFNKRRQRSSSAFRPDGVALVGTGSLPLHFSWFSIEKGLQKKKTR